MSETDITQHALFMKSCVVNCKGVSVPLSTLLGIHAIQEQCLHSSVT